MAITKKLENEIKNIYDTYWRGYLTGDLKTFASCLDDSFWLLGTTRDEVFTSKAEVVRWYKKTRGQFLGKVELRQRKVSMKMAGTSVVLHETCDLYGFADGHWSYYAPLRATTIFQKKNNRWKVVQQHGSLPDGKAEAGKTIGLDKIKAENAALREAVKRRTVELEAKNRELEIEAALERVRARTMAMQRSEELSETAAVLFKEFKKLEKDELIQVTIGTYNEAKKEIEFRATSWAGGGQQIDRPFTMSMKEPTVLKPAVAAWKAKKKSLVVDLKGKALSGWVKYRNKMTGVKIDSKDTRGRRVITIAYFAQGHLSISSPLPLPEATIRTLERFAAVFNSTYTRFLDLQKAEAQAREAEIELAMERVRSRSLAMHHTNELQSVIHAVHRELLHLNIAVSGGSFIVINSEIDTELKCWGSGGTADTSDEVHIPYFNKPFYTRILKGIKSGTEFFTEAYSQEEKVAFFKFLFEHEPWSKLSTKEKKETLLTPGGYTRSVSVSKHSSIFIINHFGEKFSESDNAILKRFGKVFEQTYTRFLDLQRAEAQAREAQIEAALERVRSASMAMHKSEELKKVVAIIFNQLKELKISLDACWINIFQNNSRDLNIWVGTPGGTEIYPEQLNIPYFSHPLFNRLVEALQNNESFYNQHIGQKSKNRFIAYMSSLFEIPKPRWEVMQKAKGLDMATALSKHASISVYNYQGIVYTDEENMVLQRISKVFEQTYTRFLDLQKAEAQAREAQIEAALERVRARSMAMHISEELSDVIEVVSDQLQQLNFRFDNVSFVINSASEDYDFWFSIPGQPKPYHIHVPYLDNPINNRAREARSKGLKFFADIVEPAESKTWFQHMFNHNQMDFLSAEAKAIVLNGGFARSVAIMPSIMLVIGNYASKPYSENENSIIRRFAKVFEQTYTRFLDLQKAEAQAREAQIETSLERVRSKTMAMHDSQDVGNTIATLFEELVVLGLEKSARCGIVIMSDSNIAEVWAASNNDKEELISIIGTLDMTLHPLLEGVKESWKSKKQNFTYKLQGADLINYYKALNKYPDYPIHVDIKSLPKEIVHNSFSFADGIIFSFTPNPIPDEFTNVFKKFASVFGQTYKRYLDLQKAEAQAREAQVEAALERVRGKAMAMHSSQDLADTIGTFYKQLQAFDLVPRRCGVGLLNKQNKEGEVYTWNTTEDGESLELVGKIKMEGHPVLENVYKNWVTKTEYHPVLRGNEIKEYYEVIKPQVAFPNHQHDEVHYGYFFMFEEGGVYAWKETPLKEDELTIYRRFTSVLSLTYKRYKDLINAEARALEATRQASLDRVRGEIASMRSTEDLQKITPLVWKELMAMGIPFTRCGVFIMDEVTGNIKAYLSAPDGHSLGMLKLNFDSTVFTTSVVDHWRRKEMYKVHWDREQFLRNMKSMIDQGQLKDVKNYQGADESPESLHLHFIYFQQGMLYVGNDRPLKDEAIDSVKALADSFSIAYSRYEDFKQVENALIELKATQSQLIQSEKMASLGELTAGIAHEIQNPLNFVNNFSEVSNELIKEIQDTRRKAQDTNGSTEEDELLNDIAGNLEKINHHGKRASDIVKGMLQHSRSSSGAKEPTDINALADEYLRLAYHGLRAKDKSFNATMKTDFDETIGIVNVVPQDIGRVVLNLINNAFYAVNEKYKACQAEPVEADSPYAPAVAVTTKKDGNSVLISIKDNGNGIPDSIKEKIFQPFFTTKPTGQGTGLGLSLAYDIVKGHGGELRVESEDSNGSTFTINLPLD